MTMMPTTMRPVSFGSQVPIGASQAQSRLYQQLTANNLNGKVQVRMDGSMLKLKFNESLQPQVEKLLTDMGMTTKTENEQTFYVDSRNVRHYLFPEKEAPKPKVQW